MNDVAADKPTEEIDKLRARLVKKLNGFSADFPADLDTWTMEASRLERSAFPVPEMVLFALRNIMGWRWNGPGEKVRWSVYGSVLSEPVGFELAKFGFTILRVPGHKVPQGRIVGQLSDAMRLIEEILEPMAMYQAQVGEVGIANRFGEFDARYGFFRDNAQSAFARAKEPPLLPKRRNSSKTGPEIVGGMIAPLLNHIHAAQREGFFHASAMVDAYFSALEHRLIMLRAFTGQPLEERGLLSFLDKSWDDKLRTILPLGADHAAGVTFGRLRRIKERLRNPLSHGGVENDGGSLFFHLPGIGALPANFSSFADSARFSFMPIEDASFEDCCSVLDAMDQLLSTGPLELPNEFLRGGVDPSFDAQTLAEYAEAVDGGAEAVDHWIESWSREWDAHANMDY